MKKLSLDMDDLRVESFETHPGARRPAGTVRGHIMAPLSYDRCLETGYCLDSGVETCPDTGWQQCGYSYGGTCGASPPDTYDGCLAVYDGVAAPRPYPYDCV